MRNSLPDISTTCHLSFNFSLGILLAAFLLEGSSAGGLLGCMCLLIGGVFMIYAKGMSAPRHSGLKSFQAFRACPFHWLLPVSIPTDSLVGFFFPPDSLPYLLTVDLCHWPL